MRCGWCGRVDESGGPNCDTCGGPLARSADGALGLDPPDVPRALPRIYLRRELFTRNSGVWVGLIFAAFGSIFPLIFLGVSIANPLVLPAVAMASIFPIPGLVIVGLSWRRARRRLEVLRSGKGALGEVADVAPVPQEAGWWRVTYLFEVDGRRYGGDLTTPEPGAGDLRPGAPVHVVYLAADPDRNDVWPLMGSRL